MELSKKQQGMTLVGLIFIMGIVACLLVVGANVFPTVTEYFGIKKAIAEAKKQTSVAAIKAAFDREADVGYITSIAGKDLEIIKNGEDYDVSFAYQRKIPLFGPASLVLDYEGTTAKVAPKTKKLAE